MVDSIIRKGGKQQMKHKVKQPFVLQKKNATIPICSCGENQLANILQ